jgi:group I intron endonuclease
MIGIYKITSPSGRIYIGQSIDIEKRYVYYKALVCKSQPKLYRSFLKYGFENHLFETIENCTIEQLNDRERYWQEFFDCIGAGLNCILIATENAPSKRCQSTKDKISKTTKGRKQTESHSKNISIGRTGMKFTEQHRLNIKISKSGANNKVSKKIINTLTNEIYVSIKDCASKIGVLDKTLSRYLLGTRTNKYPHLKYAQ